MLHNTIDKKSQKTLIIVWLCANLNLTSYNCNYVMQSAKLLSRWRLSFNQVSWSLFKEVNLLDLFMFQVF